MLEAFNQDHQPQHQHLHPTSKSNSRTLLKTSFWIFDLIFTLISIPTLSKKNFAKKLKNVNVTSDHRVVIERSSRRSSTSSGHNFGYRASILGPKKRKIIRIEKEKDWAR